MKENTYSKYARKKKQSFAFERKNPRVQEAIARTRSLKRLSTDVWHQPRTITYFYPTFARPLDYDESWIDGTAAETDGSLNEANRRKRVYRIARPHYRTRQRP